MTRTLGLAFILGTSLIACATDPGSSGTTPGDDELAGESNDGEKADANALQDTFGIYTAQKVGVNECNGAGSCTHVNLVRAERTTTTCADGKSAASCEVRYLDFSKLGLSSTKLKDVENLMEKSAETPKDGAQLLIRGKYLHGTNPTQPGVDWVTFEVDELWAAQLADGSVTGTFVMLRNNGFRCGDGACANIDEAKLNSSRHVSISGLDYPSGISSSLKSRITSATRVADGVIVTGDRTNGTGPAPFHVRTVLRTPEQVYLRVQ